MKHGRPDMRLTVKISKRKARAIIETFEQIGLASLCREIKTELRRVEDLEKRLLKH